MKTLIFLLASTVALGQAIQMTGPTNVTPQQATVSQTFTAGSVGAAVAGIQFELPASMGTAALGAAATAANKQLACASTAVGGLRRCIIYGFNDTVINSGVVSSAIVTAGGSYQLSNVLGASPTGLEVSMTVGPALQVTLPSRCDMDLNGTVNQADQDRLVQYWLGNLAIPTGVDPDIDKNGNFNGGDVQRLGRIARGVEACPQ